MIPNPLAYMSVKAVCIPERKSNPPEIHIDEISYEYMNLLHMVLNAVQSNFWLSV